MVGDHDLCALLCELQRFGAANTRAAANHEHNFSVTSFRHNFLRANALLNYLATQPPSVAIACPVANEAASDSSQTTPSAISSGLPIRPDWFGRVDPVFRKAAGVEDSFAIGVRMTRGQAQLTRLCWAA